MQNDRHDIVPAMEANAVEHGLRLWWLGGPSYAIRSPHTTLYVDPYHSDERADDPRGFIRAIPNYFFPEDVTHADVVISTHNHTDHCDPKTLGPLCARTEARILAAPSSAEMMAGWDFTTGRVDTMHAGESCTLGDMSFTAYPSKDWDDVGAVTFVVRSNDRTIFIGGDTLYFDGLEEIGREHSIDLAILALGRNRRDIIDAQVYADPEELARAARALKARRVLPIHWDIWKAWAEDPQLVVPVLAGSGTEAVILSQGESLAV